MLHCAGRNLLPNQFQLEETIHSTINEICEPLEKEIAKLRISNIAWATGVEQSNTDIVDMQRDEFQRIIAILSNETDNETADEIRSVCKRAIACIEQTVPVVVQRDQLRAQLAQAEAALGEMREALDSWLYYADHDRGQEQFSLCVKKTEKALSTSQPSEQHKQK